MRAIIAIIIFVFAVHVRAELVASCSISSYAERKRFDFEVTREQLLKTPLWRLKKDSPPLSPRKADKAATTKLRKLLKDTKGWERDRICLQDMGDGIHWIYVIEFSQRGIYGGLPPDLKIIVLMDGTVIEPKITDDR
jgi:hypothetical protein